MMHLLEAPGNVKTGGEGELGNKIGQWFKTSSQIGLTMDILESKDGMNFFLRSKFSKKYQASIHGPHITQSVIDTILLGWIGTWERDSENPFTQTPGSTT